MDASALNSPDLQRFLNVSIICKSIHAHRKGQVCVSAAHLESTGYVHDMSGYRWDPYTSLCHTHYLKKQNREKQEKEKAMVNEMVAKLTSVCWDKCITSTPGNKFSSSESACLSNCAQRFMDMTMIIMKRVQSMQ